MNADAHQRGPNEPPANIEAEQALLGTILVNNDAMDRVRGFLDPEHFSEPLHQEIYRVAQTMIDGNRLCNPVTIKSYLPQSVQVGEMNLNQYLARLAAEADTLMNAYSYGRSIHDMWARREALTSLMGAADDVRDLPSEEDILDRVGLVEEKFADLRLKRVHAKRDKHAADEWLEGLNEAMSRGDVPGVPIAFPEIQQVLDTPRFEPGNLYGLLSSSGEGKTSLTLQLIHGALTAGYPTLFLSFDQTAAQCYRQMAAQHGGISASRQSRGQISVKELEKAAELAVSFRRFPFEIKKCTNDKAGRLMGYARQFVRRHRGEHTPFVVIDHIKAITPEDPRAHEGEKAQSITRILKAGALDHECAVLLLNQRNSAGLRRDVPRPIGADLFGGESARYDYDAIFYLYRFKKWYDERKRTAGTARDLERLQKIFITPDGWDGVDDVAEIGAIKSRFGDPATRRQLIFDAPLTLYKPMNVPPQEALAL